MKKRRILIPLVSLLLILAVLLGVYHRLTWTVACNLLAPRLPLEETETWEGGTASRLFYGKSEAQYIDLYI